MHDGLIDDNLMLMRRRVMGLLLLRRGRRRLLLLLRRRMMLLLMMMMMGQVVVLVPLRRHAHRRRGPPLCELSLEACRLMRFALIGTRYFPHVFCRVATTVCRNYTRGAHDVFSRQNIVYIYVSVAVTRSDRAICTAIDGEGGGGRDGGGADGRGEGGRCCGPACVYTRGLAITSSLASLSSSSRVRDGSSDGTSIVLGGVVHARRRGSSPRAIVVLTWRDRWPRDGEARAAETRSSAYKYVYYIVLSRITYRA